MKTVLASVFSAVIAGLILFFAQNWWSDSQSSNKQSIRFDQIASINLSRSDLKDIFDKSNEYQDTTLSIYRGKNIGQEDISDRSFSGPISGVIKYGSIIYPNSNPKNADISFDGKVLSVKYKLLPYNSEHTFWVASYAPSSEIEFSNDAKGAHVFGLSDKINEENPFPWKFFGGIALIAVAFIVGVGTGASWVTGELKKRGVDADAVMKQSITPPSTNLDP
jgi:hypothetical protein